MKPSDLTPDDIGRWVEYRDFGRADRGRIKSFNGERVWVVFRCDGNWITFYNYTGDACEYRDLALIGPAALNEPVCPVHCIPMSWIERPTPGHFIQEPHWLCQVNMGDGVMCGQYRAAWDGVNHHVACECSKCNHARAIAFEEAQDVEPNRYDDDGEPASHAEDD